MKNSSPDGFDYRPSYAKKILTTFTVLLISMNSFGKNPITLIKHRHLIAVAAKHVYVDPSVNDLNVFLNEKALNKNVFQLFSHGKPGHLFIQNQWLDKLQIVDFLQKQIRHTGFPIKHINIYGCEFAKGLIGEAAVAYLEKVLKVSVAASTNITGINGDWVLEFGPKMQTIVIDKYQGNLQCTTAPTSQLAPNTSCSGNNGTITINNAVSPALNYQFSIDGGLTWQASNFFSGLAPGSYNITYRNTVNPCQSSVVTVTVANSPVIPGIPTAAASPSTSCGTPNGSLTVSPATGQTADSYSIDGGLTWQTSNVFSGLSAGSYSVMYKNATTGCISIALAKSVTGPATPGVPTNSLSNPTNCNPANGSITVTPATGQTASQYSIDGGDTWQSSNVFTGLSAGTYNVMYKSSTTGCISTAATPTLNAPTAPGPPTATYGIPTTCSPGNGTISVTPAAGQTASQYSIDGGLTWQASNNFTGLDAGTYSIRYISATSGCISTALAKTFSSPTAPGSPTSTNTNQTNCSPANGSIVVNPATGQTGSSYSIDNGVTWQTNNTFSGLTAGAYSILYKNTGGCINTTALSVTLTGPAILAAPVDSLKSDNSNCNTANGSITLKKNANLMFSINGGSTWQSSNVFSGLIDGTYSVIAKSNITGCVSAPVGIVINPPTAPAAPTTSVTASTSCSTPNGVINVTAPLGTAYQFSINNGVTWVTGSATSPAYSFTGLQANSYVVLTKTIATGCISAGTVATITTSTVTAPSGTTVAPTSCTAPNGKINITAPLGTNFQFSMDNGVTWQNGAATSPAYVYSGLAPNDYFIQTRNTTTGCISNLSIITVADPIAVTPPTAVSNASQSCLTPNGNITITAPIGAFQYSVDGVNWQSSVFFDGLSSGSYQIQTQNSVGCVSAPTVVNVGNPTVAVPSPVIVQVDATDCNPSNGSITFTPPANYANYVYSIDGGTTWQTSPVFDGLAPGNYNCYQKNISTGCLSAMNLQNVADNAATLTEASFVANSNCFGNAVETLTPLGTNYIYSNDSGLTWQTSNQFIGLGAGAFNFIAQNKNTGCLTNVVKRTFTNTFAPAIPTLTSTNQTCSNLGQIFVSAPTPLSNYMFSKDSGLSWQSSPTISGLTSGSYNVLVKANATGCTSASTVATITSSVSSFNCGDIDGDGVLNQFDLDNDNDGIVDSLERHCPVINMPNIIQTGTNFIVNNGSNSSAITFNTTLPPTNYGGTGATSTSVGGLSFYYNEATVGSTVTNIFTVKTTAGSVPVIRWGFGAGDLTVGLGNWAGAVSQNMDAVLTWNGGGTAVVTDPDDVLVGLATGDIITSGTLIQYRNPANPPSGTANQNNSNWYFDINTGTASSGTFMLKVFETQKAGWGTVDVQSIGIPLSGSGTCSDVDTDKDGIPDYLDLDSDGDGCPDALEGGGGFTNANLKASNINGGNTNTLGIYNGTVTYPVKANLGNLVDANGIPVIASGGQSIGSSENIAVQGANCCPAGYAGPNITPYSLTNTCPNKTVNIAVLTSTIATPVGATKVWTLLNLPQNDNDTLTTAQASAISVSGKYYSVFRDKVSGCFSQLVDSVSVSISPCTNPALNTTWVGVPVNGNLSTNQNLSAGTTFGNPVTDPAYPANPGNELPVINPATGTYSFTASTPGVYHFLVPVCPAGQSTGCPLISLTITVLDPNTNVKTNPPVANIDLATAVGTNPVTLKTLANDLSGNPSTSLVPASLTISSQPKHGTVTVDPLTGNTTYTPDGSGFIGADTLFYNVCDNASPANCQTSSQIINNVPTTISTITTAADAYTSVPLGTNASGNLIANCASSTNLPLTIAAQSNVAVTGGIFSIDANGNYTFVPNSNFSGPVDIPYTVCDNSTPTPVCATATLHILVSPSLPLPIILSKFEVKLNGCNDVSVNWSVSLEVNLKNYELQYSIDGNNYKTIKLVNPIGINQVYSVADNPAIGNAFYRLKINNLDGSVSFSNKILVSIHCGKNLPALVFPNPAKNILNVNIKNGDAVTNAMIINSNGQAVLNTVLHNGINQINVSALPGGLYILKLNSTSGMEIVKINIE